MFQPEPALEDMENWTFGAEPFYDSLELGTSDVSMIIAVFFQITSDTAWGLLIK